MARSLLPPRLSARARRVAAFTALVRRVGIRRAIRDRRLGSHFARVSNETLARVSEEIWRSAAAELGAEMRRLSPTVVEVRLGDRFTRISHFMTTQLADRVSGELALDKPVVLGLLAEAGISVPDHVAVERGDVNTAARFLEHTGPTVVVKPADSAGGAGIVGSIASLHQLKAALLSSGRYADRLLVERQLSGDSYRLTFLDGVLIDVVRRLPPRLTGDGTSTVAALLLAEFKRRIEAGGDARGFKPFDVDLDCVFTLAAQRLSLDSVLAAGQSARVRTATNYTGPEHSFTALGSVGNEVVAAARAAAGVVGMRLAGVDVVTPDATRPLADVGGAVLEVNAPALHHHYNVADREAATRVAVPILASLLGLSPTNWPGTASNAATQTNAALRRPKRR